MNLDEKIERITESLSETISNQFVNAIDTRDKSKPFTLWAISYLACSVVVAMYIAVRMLFKDDSTTTIDKQKSIRSN